MRCRFCDAPVDRTFLDLGMQPLSNAYVRESKRDQPETFYPLHVRVCERCLLVQLPECASPDQLFQDYAYLSSMSASWLAHAKAFAEESTRRFGLSATSRVVEVASNDGYLLKHFQGLGIPVIGIEPAANVAALAREAGVPTHAKFFGYTLARELVRDGGPASLVVANNVLAHVPDLNDFVRGLAAVLAADGVLSLEFPHLARLLAQRQFDTIYHEHFSYFSFGTAKEVLRAHDLEVFDVEELTTHGGSLRVYAQRAGAGRSVGQSVARVEAREEREGGRSLTRYDRFAKEVVEVKRALLTFLIEEKRRGRSIVAYGAPAKGNTLLNFAGVRGDFVDYAVDKSPLKQGTLLPGTRIPVYAPERIAATRPEVIVILPWNLEAEVAEQLSFTREWGARLVVPIPEIRTLS
jgi:SAM-dependent methyltransferase